MAEAISLAKELNDLHGLAVTLWHAGWLAYFARNRVEVEHCASELIELSTRQNFILWLAGGKIFRGWARSASGHMAEGISWINEGIRDFRATGAIGSMPGYLLLKAEALHLAARTAEALEAIAEAHALMETYEERWPAAELHRLRAVLLAATGGDGDEVEASFRAAISTAKQQKSLSLEKRAEATYAEYRRHQASRLNGGRGCAFIYSEAKLIFAERLSMNAEPGERQDLSAREVQTCVICGANFSATKENDFCPVCLLRGALDVAIESEKSDSEKAVGRGPDCALQRFEHYEVALGGGQPDRLNWGGVRWASPTRQSTSIFNVP